MNELLVLSCTSGASSFADDAHELESDVVAAGGTVTVTAPSKPYGTSTPGVLRPSARTYSTW